MCMPPVDPEMERLLEEARGDDQDVLISADDADLVREGISRLTGDVQIRGAGRLLRAESAEFDSDTLELRVTGGVEYRDGNLIVRSEDADFDGTAQRIEFSASTFSLPRRPARGGAGSLEVRGDRTVRLRDVLYTSCPEGNEDWRLRAGDIRLDADSGFGTGRNVRVDFLGVPILYTPWITFPITDDRKSGFLFPQLRRSNRTGADVSVPYYFNLAPNYDLTLEPRLMSRRGLLLGSEFRYLTRSSEGQAGIEFLPSDQVSGDDRRYTNLFHRTGFGERIRLTVDGSEVSDGAYFEDLGGGVVSTSQTHLDRRLDVEYLGRDLRALARFQGYQTIDEQILDEERPYRRLPQFLVEGHWPERWLGTDLRLTGELVNFDRRVGVTGWRMDMQPEISRRFGPPGLYLRPAVALQHTRYRLDNLPEDAPRDPSRTLPIGTLDLGALFEREVRDGRLLQTLEPRLQYVHIPFRDQDRLPVFDTIEPDFGLVQLFRSNRYLGVDRVGDTDQVNLGLTTRVLDETSGRERLRLTLGQTRYLADAEVGLPGAPPPGRNSSEYVGELGLVLAERWRLDLGQQWNSDLSATTRSEARLQYRRDDQRLINLAYRFRRGALEQGDVSFMWPASERWNFIGRYNYSLRERASLDRFAGVEYRSCCFSVSLVARRYISRRTGGSDTAIALQIELRGLASVGDSTRDFIERGIIGYDRDIF
ncbi:MAG: LPS-assembly protein LptD [Gammaproteobacteria bacterium]|nr:MAG: LPS-assembly protein LptD [Gammaproteobacteria bacterium]